MVGPAGLADLAVKDWRGKGFDSILDQLIDHLRSDVPWRDTKVGGHQLKASYFTFGSILFFPFRSTYNVSSPNNKKKLQKMM